MPTIKDPEQPVAVPISSSATLAETNQALTQDVASLESRVSALEHQLAKLSSQIAKLNIHTHTLETTPSESTGLINFVDVKNFVLGGPSGQELSDFLVLVRNDAEPQQQPSQYQSAPPTGISP